MFKYALVLLMLCSNSIYCAALSREEKGGLAHGHLIEAKKLYKENFGNPEKLFKFEKKDVKKVGAKANVVLANLALYVEECIKQKDARTAREVMGLFSKVEYIRMEARKSSSRDDLHEEVFKLWPQIRALEEAKNK